MKNSSYSWFSYYLYFAAVGIINFSEKPPFFVFASDTEQTSPSVSGICCSKRPVSSHTAICVYLRK